MNFGAYFILFYCYWFRLIVYDGLVWIVYAIMTKYDFE